MKALRSFVATFFGMCVVLVFALAFTETYTHRFITLGGSRSMLLYAGLAIAAAMAGLRVVGVARRKPAETAPSAIPAARVAAQLRTQGQGLSASAAPSGTSLQSPGVPADLATIDRAAHQAIVFRQLMPPQDFANCRSFFGGLPLCTEIFEWPKATLVDGTTRPLHFLMQIDCAAIPEKSGLGLMPSTGVLYIFMDFEWGGDFAHCVIHKESIGKSWRQLSPPELGPLFGDSNASYIWPWAETSDINRRILPKWPFEPVAINVPDTCYADSRADLGGDFRYLWQGGEAINAALVAAQGDEVRYQPLELHKYAQDTGRLQRPFQNFPQDWHAVKLTAALTSKYATRMKKYPSRSATSEHTPEDYAARMDNVVEDAQRWLSRARASDAASEVPQDVREEFWNWLDSQREITRHVLEDATVKSVEASLTTSSTTAARIPPSITTHLQSRHALAIRTGEKWHVNTPDRMLAAPSDVQGNQWDRAATHLLLLEISSNEGLGHHFGEGVYQFWITPENLRARRFDRVELTADAY